MKSGLEPNQERHTFGKHLFGLLLKSNHCARGQFFGIDTEFQTKSKAANITADIEEITPEMANELLVTNINNRELRQSTLDRYAAQIQDGLWELNGDSICISRDNKLLDGQHRLHAVVRANLPITSVVVRGLDPATFHTKDLGRPRTPADIFFIKGEKNVFVLTAALRLLAIYKRGDGEMKTEYGRAKGTILPNQLEKLLDSTPAIRNAVNICASAPHKKFLPGSVSAFLYYVLYSKNKTFTNQFFEKLGTQNKDLKPEDITILTLQGLLKQQKARGYTNQLQTSAYLILAWNAWITGKKLTSISWERANDFPKIVFPEKVK